jgi:protein TonB
MSLLPAFLSDSLDEVVFEGRNRAYGAYQLRQDYQQNLASAGGLTLLFGALLFFGAAGWSRLHPKEVAPRTHPVIVETIDVAPPKQTVIEHAKVAPASPPPRARAATHAAPTMSTQVAKDDAPQPKLDRPMPSELVEKPSGLVATSNTGTEAPSQPGTALGPGTDVGPATTPSEPFVAVEKMPEFAGGQAALLRYLQKHLRYPGSALAAGVGGRVFMSFVVGADGSISDVTILKGLGYGLDEEAQRVVRQMPAWVPGYQSKHAVPVRFTLPITFAIQ